MPTPPRGTLVLDIGSTNTKLVLFDGAARPLRERRVESRHVPGPPYRSLDPEPALALLAEALPDFDAELPVDVIVPCAHGSALALLDEDGGLALPVMDYFAEPPAEIADAYREIAPPFAEVFCPTNPMALTLGLQLFWQETMFPEQFARVRTILPWGQYFAYRMSGRAVTGPHRARRADAARRRHRQPLLVAGARPRLGPAVRAAGAPFETLGTLKPELRRSAARRPRSRSRPASMIPTPTICGTWPPGSAISRCCRPAPGSSSSTPDRISAASTRAATPPPTPTCSRARSPAAASWAASRSPRSRPARRPDRARRRRFRRWSAAAPSPCRPSPIRAARCRAPAAAAGSSDRCPRPRRSARRWGRSIAR